MTSPFASPTTRDTSDLLYGYKQLCEAQARYELADEYYDGDIGEVFASAKVKRLLSRSGADEIPEFNYARIPVDTVANRLQIQAVVAVPPETEDPQNPPEGEPARDATLDAQNQALHTLWADNELDAESKAVHKKVSTYGDTYLLVWPVVDQEEEDEQDEPEREYSLQDELEDDGDQIDDEADDVLPPPGKVVGVDMRHNDATQMRVIYDDEDPLRIAYAIKHWEVEMAGATIHRANLYYRDRIEKWRTDGVKDAKDPEAWTQIGEVDNPYDRVPVFHFRNDRPYGFPEHLGAFGPQQMLNKLITSHAAVIDFQSFPQRYLMIDPAKDDPTANSDDPIHPDDDAEDPETDTGTSGMSSDPGSVWKLWGASTGEYSAAQPNIFLEPFDRYVKAMAELTDTPQHHFSKSTGDTPSGSALRALEAPTITKCKDRQDRYEPTWKDAFGFALFLLGFGQEVHIDIQWAPLMVIDDAEGWSVVQTKIATGVPTEVALTETGYPSEQVQEWIQDADGADLARRIAMLNQIGTAVLSFGQGIALGAVSKEQVQEVFSKVLGLTLEGTEITLPTGTFVDPQEAATKQVELQQAALDQQAAGQQAQLDHATASQQSSQEHNRRMAVEAHERMRETMKQQGPPTNSPNGRKTPTGR